MAQQINNQLLQLINDPTMMFSLKLGFGVFIILFLCLLFVSGSSKSKQPGRKQLLRPYDQLKMRRVQDKFTD